MDNQYKIDFSNCFENAPHKTEISYLQNTIDYYKNEVPAHVIHCFTLDNILSKATCENLITISEKIGYKDLAQYRKDYRGNQRVMLYCGKSAKIIFNLIRGYLPKISGSVPSHINPLFRFGKYNKNDAFGAHKDSSFSTENSESLLTIMFYLNESNGKTRMLTLNKTCKKSEDINCCVLDAIVPAPGKCVIFTQREIYHDGESVGDCARPKYIMRSDVMYSKEK